MINLIIFDWKRTLYDPDKKEPIKGAIELLQLIEEKNIPMVLIGKGGEDMNEEVTRLGVRKYFNEVVFAQGDKDPQVFKKYISQAEPKNTWIIGDRVRSELEIGNKLGATTIWIKQGKFATEEPQNPAQQPKHIVTSLMKLKDLISSLD